MNGNDTAELLSIAQHYYSIGLPYYNLGHPGFEQLKKIVDGKIGRLIKKERIPMWDDFVELIQLEFTDKPIINTAFTQFPNYSLRIDLENSTGDREDIAKSLCVNVSLLCNYFTVYIDYRLTLPEFNAGVRNPKLIILYGSQHAVEKEKELLARVKELLSSVFNDYKFVGHSQLFRQQIQGGLPYGEDIASLQPGYPIFYYLFGLNDAMAPTDVLD